MLEAYNDHAASLPFAGLITKLIRFCEMNITPNENIVVPQGRFGKATVQKYEAQLQGRHNVPEALATPPPIVSGASSSSSSPFVSMASLIEQITAMAQLMSSMERRLISMEERNISIKKS